MPTNTILPLNSTQCPSDFIFCIQGGAVQTCIEAKKKLLEGIVDNNKVCMEKQ